MDQLFKALWGSKLFYEILFPKIRKKMADDLEKKKSVLEDGLASIERQLDNILSTIQKFQGEDIQPLLEKIKSRATDLESRRKDIKAQLDAVNKKLANLPTKAKVQDIWAGLKDRIRESRIQSGPGFLELPFEKRKRFVNTLFNGKDENGRKFGIYFRTVKEGKKKIVKWEAHGDFQYLMGEFTVDKERCPVE